MSTERRRLQPSFFFIKGPINSLSSLQDVPMCRLLLRIAFACFSGQIGAKFSSNMYVFPSASVTSFPKVLLNYPFFVFFSLFLSGHWIFFFPFHLLKYFSCTF